MPRGPLPPPRSSLRAAPAPQFLSALALRAKDTRDLTQKGRVHPRTRPFDLPGVPAMCLALPPVKLCIEGGTLAVAASVPDSLDPS